MAQVAQAPAYGGLRQSDFDRPRTSSQDEEEVVSVRHASAPVLAASCCACYVTDMLVSSCADAHGDASGLHLA